MRHAAAIAALGTALAAPVAGQTYELTETDTWKVVQSPEPGSPAERLAAARAALAAGEPQRARNLASAWIKSNPDDPLIPEAYLLRGDALLAQEDYYKALYDYEFVARLYPGSETFVTVLERELQIGTLYARGTKRKFMGMRLLDAGDVAEELLIRIQERMPGSRLAELAGIELADYYFARRQMDLAAEMYSIFLQNNPRSEFVSKARRRLIYAHLASFKGPQWDASGLHEARSRLKELKALEPATAEEIGADALLARIDESDARKLLVTAQWYNRVGDPVAAELYVRRLVETFPRTVAAADAMRFMEKVVPKLPASVLAAAPDYRALRQAILGGDSGGGAPVRAFPLLTLLLAAGCASEPSRGYALVSTFPGGASTVAVDVFESRSYEREIAFELADALVKEIEARTPYKVTSASRADTILTGRIRSVERQQLSKSPLTGLSEEVALGVTIDMQWKDLRSGQTMLHVDALSAHSMFDPSRPISEPIEIGQFGAVQKLAREIVDEMRKEW